MPEEPYAPPPASNFIEPATTKPKGRVTRRWVRAFIILNVILAALPILVTALVYVLNSQFFQSFFYSDDYDPIVYQHTVLISVNPLGFLAYLLIPNCILFITWQTHRR